MAEEVTAGGTDQATAGAVSHLRVDATSPTAAPGDRNRDVEEPHCRPAAATGSGPARAWSTVPATAEAAGPSVPIAGRAALAADHDGVGLPRGHRHGFLHAAPRRTVSPDLAADQLIPPRRRRRARRQLCSPTPAPSTSSCPAW